MPGAVLLQKKIVLGYGFFDYLKKILREFARGGGGGTMTKIPTKMLFQIEVMLRFSKIWKWKCSRMVLKWFPMKKKLMLMIV